MTSLGSPEIAFLGITDRISQAKDHENGAFWSYNVLGLRAGIIAPIFPMNLTGIFLLFAAYLPTLSPDSEIVIRRSDGEEFITVKIGLRPVDAPDIASRAPGRDLLGNGLTWQLVPIKIEGRPFILTKPDNLRVFLRRAGIEMSLGHLVIAYGKQHELSPDRIAAIRADPLAGKAVQLLLKCTECHDELAIHAALDRTDVTGLWYRDAPSTFTCECGKAQVNLDYVRENLHACLGRTRWREAASVTRLYERATLQGIYGQFIRVLEEETEEPIQQFLQENPIVLAPFSPTRIFFKAPILSKYKTDFALVTPKMEVVLIEIERARTPVVKSDGGLSAKAQHAFDQARSWLFECETHRQAVLEGIGLTSQEALEISAIRAVVVLGRNALNDPESLRRTNWTDFGKVSFMTYDSLLGNLDDLCRHIDSL